MQLFRDLLVAWVSLALYNTRVSAQECNPDKMGLGDGSGAWEISSQDQLDTIANNCSTMVGDILLTADYRGSVRIPRVSNITGYIKNPWMNNHLTSIELPDVLYLGGAMVSTSDLVSVSAPKVTEIDAFRIENASPLNVSLPSLETVTELSMTGGFLNLDLSELKTVKWGLKICGDDECKPEPGQPLNISFPALETVWAIEIVGTIAEFSMPHLAIVHGEPVVAPVAHLPGVSVTNLGDPIPMKFPMLSLIEGQLNLEGAISEFSVPELTNTTAMIRLNTTSSLDVLFDALVNATAIHLVGHIASAYFPALKFFDSIRVISERSVDCTGVAQAEERASGPNDEHEGKDDGTVLCTTADLWALDQSSPAAVRGIIGGSVVGVAVFIGIVVAVVFYWKRKRRNKARAEAREMELCNRVPVQRPCTPPPPYSPPEYTP